MKALFRYFAFAALPLAVAACKQDDPFKSQAEPQPVKFSVLNAITTSNVDIQIRRGDSAVVTVASNLAFGKQFPAAGYMDMYTYDTRDGDTAQPQFIRVLDAVSKSEVLAWQPLELTPKLRHTMYLIPEELPKPPVSIDNFSRPESGNAQVRFINFNKGVASAHLMLFGADTVSIRDTGYSTASSMRKVKASRYTIVFLSGTDTVQKMKNFLFENRKTYSFHLLKNPAGNAEGSYIIKD